MSDMTEEEYNVLDEKWTKNPPKPGPNGTGFFAQRKADLIQQASLGFSGLSANEVTGTFINAVEQDIAEKKRKGVPVAHYDLKLKRAYLENADGTREYV